LAGNLGEVVAAGSRLETAPTMGAGGRAPCIWGLVPAKQGARRPERKQREEELRAAIAAELERRGARAEGLLQRAMGNRAVERGRARRGRPRLGPRRRRIHATARQSWRLLWDERQSATTVV
jgi:hypothetical protein